jgi:hypothetical protein
VAVCMGNSLSMGGEASSQMITILIDTASARAGRTC